MGEFFPPFSPIFCLNPLMAKVIDALMPKNARGERKREMNANKREWNIPQENELRCEVKEDEWLTIRLVTGTAEIFGVELAPNKEYTFHDQNFAVFTWYGCTVETSGLVASSPYVADSTPMVAYVNTHIQLEARRDVALANSDSGPRVRIIFTFCKIVNLILSRLW